MWKPGNQGGRPSVGPKVETRLPVDELQKVDDFAAAHDFSRAEALRQLISDGLLLAASSTRKTMEPDAIQSEKVDPSDPLFVHTMIRWALKKVGMGQAEADQYAAAHQQHAVDAYRATEQ